MGGRRAEVLGRHDILGKGVKKSGVHFELGQVKNGLRIVQPEALEHDVVQAAFGAKVWNAARHAHAGAGEDDDIAGACDERGDVRKPGESEVQSRAPFHGHAIRNCFDELRDGGKVGPQRRRGAEGRKNRVAEPRNMRQRFGNGVLQIAARRNSRLQQTKRRRGLGRRRATRHHRRRSWPPPPATAVLAQVTIRYGPEAQGTKR